MKKRNYLRALGVGILVGVLPMMVSANELIIKDLNALNYSSLNELSLIDSIAKSKKQDDKDSKKEKDKDSKKQPDADKAKEPKQDPKVVEVDPKQPNIKEVPKARPKLRPGVVTDRIKIKRPPVKVKHGRLHSVGL